MRLLILCDDPGLRTAFGVRFVAHRQPVLWLESEQPLPFEFIAADEPVLIIDGLGGENNLYTHDLTADLRAQLIANCNRREWTWLLLSDSRVFRAPSKRRCAETDATTPSTDAGKQLLARERLIAENVERHLVLRTGPLIAAEGNNLLTRLLRQFRDGGAMAVPDGQRFCPTPVADVARVVAAMHDQLDCGATCWGIYHYESADPANAYEFAEIVLAAATQYWPIAQDPVQLHGSAVDNTAEIFPLLNCQRIRDTFGVQQLPWRKAIPAMLKQIHALNSSETDPS